jgi:hypothetical protein
MPAAPFDTLKLTKALREKAHFTPEQAEGITEAFGEAFYEQLATKQDLSLLEQHLVNSIDHMALTLGTAVVVLNGVITFIFHK